MKKIKYFILFFIITLLIILNGELFQNELDTFTSDYYYIEYEYIEGQDRGQLIRNIEDSCNKNDVSVFSVSKSQEEMSDYNIDIYGNEDVYKILNNTFAINEGEYKSILSGNTNISYFDFSKLAFVTRIGQFYLIGDDENVSNALDDIFELEGSTRVQKEREQMEAWIIPMLWIVLFLFLLLLTSFDIGFQKKEVFIKISVGASVWKIILTNIIKDVSFYLLSFVLINLVLKNHTYIYYRLPLFAGLFIVFLVLNALLYLVLLKYNLKQALSGKSITNSLRGNCYVIKIFTMMLTMITVASNVLVIKEGSEFLKQNEVIEKYEDYSFLNILSYQGTGQNDFDYEYYTYMSYNMVYDAYKNDILAISNLVKEDSDYRKYLCVNENAKYSIESIKELENIDETKGVHILIPQKEILDSDEISDVALDDILGNLYSTLKDQEYEVIEYTGKHDILFFDHSFILESGYIQNPIIVYCTFDGSVFNDSREIEDFKNSRPISKFNYIMYNITEEEIDRIEEKYDLENKGMYISPVKVTDSYNYYKTMIERALVVNSAISGLMLLLEIIIISVILRMEYVINADELAIKKVLGYSIMQKNKSVVLLILCSSILGIVSTVIAVLMYDIVSWYLIVMAGLLIVALENIILVYFVMRIERTSVTKILKGGKI